MEEFTQSEYQYVADLLRNVLTMFETAGAEQDETLEAFIKALDSENDLVCIEDPEDEDFAEAANTLFDRLRNR